jgi:signal transduction histidine kinase
MRHCRRLKTKSDLPARVAFIESAVHQTFGFRSVSLLALQEAIDNDHGPALDKRLLTPAASRFNVRDIERLVASLPADNKEVVRADARHPQDLLNNMRSLHLNYLFILRFEKRPVGLLLVDSYPLADLGDVEDLLIALCGQIAGSLVNGRLLDAKLRLEREMARQERLAHLGRMAATMAHEVKNPLSSVKTLIQLMREDEKLQESHGQDLRLINEEIDRLNRTVSQLLSFARPQTHDGHAGPRSDLLISPGNSGHARKME